MTTATLTPTMQAKQVAGLNLLPYEMLGAKENKAKEQVHFGIIFPEITQSSGYKVYVKVINEIDQFTEGKDPEIFELQNDNSVYDGYWSADIKIQDFKSSSDSDKYIYWYKVTKEDENKSVNFVIDPFAREFGTGKSSAFTLNYEEHLWSANEKVWKTPALNDLIVYELSLNEFAGGIEGTIKKLDYLQSLGINCIEVMPVSNVEDNIEWGYLPIGYFGIDERFGRRSDFLKLIDEAHKRGIAVIVDVVYGHTNYNFAYCRMYNELGFSQSPLNGSFANDYFSNEWTSTDYNKEFTRKFFDTVNYNWLKTFHIDGFRYDCVPNFYDGCAGAGYSNLVYKTFQFVKSMENSSEDYWQRFFNNGEINLVQCAEQLECPKEIVGQTYSNCTWQDTTYGKAKCVVHSNNEIERYAIEGLGLDGYPMEVPHFYQDEDGNNIQYNMKKSVFQYLENHDHRRFICEYGLVNTESGLFTEGNRNSWYKIQPFMISLMTSKGIPMLWEGQELCENYTLPESGSARVKMFRDVRWDYFYDNAGQGLVNLVRSLTKIRSENSEFRNGEFYFYNNWERYQSKGVLLIGRWNNERFSLTAMNFSDWDQWVPFWFPVSGNYTEELHQEDNLQNVQAYQEYWIKVPSNYGRIWSVNK